jgi:sulfatase maturation enzyme AslB (radical SAM superfamily)
LESQPECSQCVYNPYCGVCPTYNYVEQGDVFGQMMTNERCKKLKGIFGYIFEKVRENDPDTMAIFKRWGSWRDPDPVPEEAV